MCTKITDINYDDINLTDVHRCVVYDQTCFLFSLKFEKYLCLDRRLFCILRAKSLFSFVNFSSNNFISFFLCFFISFTDFNSLNPLKVFLRCKFTYELFFKAFLGVNFQI